VTLGRPLVDQETSQAYLGLVGIEPTSPLVIKKLRYLIFPSKKMLVSHLCITTKMYGHVCLLLVSPLVLEGLILLVMRTSACRSPHGINVSLIIVTDPTNLSPPSAFLWIPSKSPLFHGVSRRPGIARVNSIL
jgi:hypothetical protein